MTEDADENQRAPKPKDDSITLESRTLESPMRDVSPFEYEAEMFVKEESP